jgi:hypothetical protein
MDTKTNHILNQITKGIPRHLAENVTQKIVDDSGEQLAKAAINDPHISYKKKEQLRKYLYDGKFRKEETAENEATINALDDYHTAEIAKARRSGALADPMSDPFYRQRMERLAKGDVRKAEPLTRNEISNAIRALRRNDDDD